MLATHWLLTSVRMVLNLRSTRSPLRTPNRLRLRNQEYSCVSCTAAPIEEQRLLSSKKELSSKSSKKRVSGPENREKGSWPPENR